MNEDTDSIWEFSLWEYQLNDMDRLYGKFLRKISFHDY